MGIVVEEKGPDQTLMEVKAFFAAFVPAAGAARFGIPIGGVIRPDVVPNRPTHVSTRIDATGGDSSIKPLKGIDKDLDDDVLKGRISIRRAREIQKRRNTRAEALAAAKKKK